MYEKLSVYALDASVRSDLHQRRSWFWHEISLDLHLVGPGRNYGTARNILTNPIASNGWNVGASVIVTIGGWLSDTLGRRYFLLFGAVFGAGPEQGQV